MKLSWSGASGKTRWTTIYARYAEVISEISSIHPLTLTGQLQGRVYVPEDSAQSARINPPASFRLPSRKCQEASHTVDCLP